MSRYPFSTHPFLPHACFLALSMIHDAAPLFLPCFVLSHNAISQSVSALSSFFSQKPVNCTVQRTSSSSAASSPASFLSPRCVLRAAQPFYIRMVLLAILEGSVERFHGDLRAPSHIPEARFRARIQLCLFRNFRVLRKSDDNRTLLHISSGLCAQPKSISYLYMFRTLHHAELLTWS